MKIYKHNERDTVNSRNKIIPQEVDMNSVFSQ